MHMRKMYAPNDLALAYKFSSKYLAHVLRQQCA